MRFDINDLKRLCEEFEEMFNGPKVSNVEEPKKEEPKKEEDTVGKCEMVCSEEEGCELCNCIYAFDENAFELTHHVGEYLVNNATYLEFEHKDMENDTVVPGITEKQLLRILLYRNRYNKERSELIEKLLNE